MKYLTLIVLLMILDSSKDLSAQKNNFQFKGQASAFGNYSPDNDLSLFIGARYIPQINYNWNLDSTSALDFELALNIYGNTSFEPFYRSQEYGDIDPYRAWVRYSQPNYEIRAGLQKIDFGSAILLRPLQWFNQVDPRDPLSLTNGVYGLLGRYYFKNNANIWLWGLYGNEKTRGFDAVKTYKKHPEFGGRIQLPIYTGEIAFSYHHRTADLSDFHFMNSLEQIPENRYGFDIKLDVKVGLWLEASHVQKTENVGALTNQTLLNLGTDYTFGIGNGLNVVLEHLITNNSERALRVDNNEQITATNLTYPISMFDNLSVVAYYSWDTAETTFFLNWEHQFKKMTGYAMVYYNPEVQEGIQENELVNTFSGPGIRLMLVYNH